MATDLTALEKRVEEAAREVIESFDHFVFNSGLRALEAYRTAVEALAEARERAKCCANVCERCAKGDPIRHWTHPDSKGPGHAYHPTTHNDVHSTCYAWSIHLRAARENSK